MNICGCLIHIAPGKEALAREAMQAMPGVEVHAESEDHRFVVVVEDTKESFASEIIMELHKVPGVLSLTLNFHHFEDPAETHPRLAPAPQHTSGGPIHDSL
ncbi:chaperone NapD [Primorskyibacter sp. S187A]|uniref:chaperone NapD n=1 Tax=Primorskyibacter sp. S187A TaxID=3415130 RepID=UPI003C7E15BC